MKNHLKVTAIAALMFAMAHTPAPVRADGDPGVEIEVNQTSEATDDLVRLGDSTPCRARLTGTPKEDISVVFTEAQQRLGFSYPNGATSLSLPKNLDWVEFSIFGSKGSAAKDDAKMEAHKGDEKGTVIGSKTASVFWFTNARMNVTKVGAYTLSKPNTLSDPDYRAASRAVDMVGQLYVQPAGLSSSAPQLSDLEVGIVQNMILGVYKRVWKNPVWTPPAIVRANESVTTKTNYEDTITLPYTANDFSGTGPLYVAGVSVTSGMATTNDNPHWTLPDTINVPAISNIDHSPSGSITFYRDHISIQGSFIDWVVLRNKTSKAVETFRQNEWSLNISSDATTAQEATTNPFDHAPTSSPKLDGESANTLVADPANRKKGPTGTDVTLQ